MEAPNLSRYASAKRNVNNDFAAKESAYQFSRGLSQRRGARDRADARQSFRRSQPGFQASWGSRGMGDSGFYKEALQRRTSDHTRNLGRMREDQQSQLSQLDMQRASDTQARDRALADIDLAKAEEIASVGRWLEQLRPYLGR